MEEYPKYSSKKLDMGKSCIRFTKPEKIPFKLFGELMSKMTVKDWIGKYQGSGKVCVTAAICEQSEASAMGSTLSLLTDFSRDIGLDVIESVEGLGFFEAGSIRADHNLLQKAEKVGQKLFDQLKG